MPPQLCAQRFEQPLPHDPACPRAAFREAIFIKNRAETAPGSAPLSPRPPSFRRSPQLARHPARPRGAPFAPPRSLLPRSGLPTRHGPSPAGRYGTGGTAGTAGSRPFSGDKEPAAPTGAGHAGPGAAGTHRRPHCAPAGANGAALRSGSFPPPPLCLPSGPVHSSARRPAEGPIRGKREGPARLGEAKSGTEFSPEAGLGADERGEHPIG